MPSRRVALRSGLALIILLLARCADKPEVASETAPPANLPMSISATIGDPRMAQLGRALFFDQTLSINRNQSCAACHGEEWGFTGPDTAINARGAVYKGSIPGRYGDRKPTASSYATRSPVLRRQRAGTGYEWVGGNFWDGRATGEKLGNPAADQAQGPFLNPAEQALPDAACVVHRVANAPYVDLYTTVWGNDIRSIAFPANTETLCAREGSAVLLSAQNRARVENEFNHIALAIAAFEDSPEVNSFSSKFDAVRAGDATFTPEEQRGYELFQGKARCERCHPSQGSNPLFTNFTYDNVGVPRNPDNPVYGEDPRFLDLGLGRIVKDSTQNGKVKVPTLRNVDRRPFPDAIKAYMHNGVFKSIEHVVHFYNTRDVLERCESVARPVFAVNCWPSPEVEANLNRSELGDMGLSADEERAIASFLKTLSDGYARR